jgi:hypothetical protein
MQDHSIGMYSGIFPQKRAYTLFRNVAELKDVPRSLLSLRDSLTGLSKFSDALEKAGPRTRELLHSLRTVRDQVPKEWLSYWFGWRQLYSDVVGLLDAPAKIGKKIDFLVRRNSKPTTYRSRKVIIENGTPPDGFLYDFSLEDSIDLKHSYVRTTELKMVVNTTFDFPPTDLPNFRQKEFYRQLGAFPTPVDLYNLVPWTWLFDWFTGFGNYLEVIEGINSDDKLINWGLITAKVGVELETAYIGKVKWSKISGEAFDEIDNYSIVEHHHISKLHYTLQLRRDLSTILGVRTTGDKASLSPYQLSILAAILSTRGKFRST